uniref:Peptidase M14 domain-containing protein n=1 Tax=Anopheles culicifacies TaxID=139723 RepID=A0A182MRH7_9DIPT
MNRPVFSLRAEDVDNFNPLDFYLTTDEANTWLEALADRYPEKSTVSTIGKSYEGNNINAITINPDQTRKVILVANLRAREWIAMSSAIYIIHELLRNSNSYPQANNFQWIIVPVPNPDGYEYTKTNDRSWCKNRVPQSYNDYGVDLDRNFAYKWEDSIRFDSNDPAAETFRGTGALSEPETQGITDLLQYHADAYLYVDIQVFGQRIFIPWGYTEELAPNVNLLQSVAEAGASAIYAQSNQAFQVGTPAELEEIAAGSSMDFCNSIGIKASVTLKVSSDTYDLPPENIIPVGQEAFIAVIAMAEKAGES